MVPEHGKEKETQVLEEKIEDLTREISRLISTAETKGREELREYAISLLQGEIEAGPVVEVVAAALGSTNPFNPLGISIPLFLIGGILLFLFPPVGVILLAAAVVMGVWAVLWSLFFRKQ